MIKYIEEWRPVRVAITFLAAYKYFVLCKIIAIFVAAKQKRKDMATTNLKLGHIVKYANQVGMIISTCKENGYSIVLSDGNEVNADTTELEGVPLSKNILEIIGFKQFGTKSYISNFLRDSEKSKLGYDYPRLNFDFYNEKVSVSVFFHKIESRKDKESHHSITYLHELQEVYRSLGYTIPISTENLSLF